MYNLERWHYCSFSSNVKMAASSSVIYDWGEKTKWLFGLGIILSQGELGKRIF